MRLKPFEQRNMDGETWVTLVNPNQISSVQSEIRRFCVVLAGGPDCVVRYGDDAKEYGEEFLLRCIEPS